MIPTDPLVNAGKRIADLADRLGGGIVGLPEIAPRSPKLTEAIAGLQDMADSLRGKIAGAGLQDMADSLRGKIAGAGLQDMADSLPKWAIAGLPDMAGRISKLTEALVDLVPRLPKSGERDEAEEAGDELGTALGDIGLAAMPADQQFSMLYEVVIAIKRNLDQSGTDVAESKAAISAMRAEMAALRADTAETRKELAELLARSLSQKAKKWAAFILTTALGALLGYVLTAVYEYYFNDFKKAILDQKKQKEIKKALIRIEPELVVCDLRLVRRDTDARADNRAKSQRLAILRRGSLVKIIDRGKKWTFVEYEDEMKVRQAWVRHKYLERLI